jgi:UPF0716 family protein affecting phage T7 exclusion
MSADDRPRPRPSIGVLVALLLVVLLAVAGVLFWLAQGTAPSTGSTTNGSLGVLVVLLAPT